MAGTNGLDWRLDIGRTRSLDIVGMPLLHHYVTTLGPTLLAGVHILYVNHLISDSLMVARGFKRLGARLTSIAIPYSGIYGPVQRAVHQGFKHLGPTYLPRVSHPSQFPAAMSVAVRRPIAQLTDGLPAGERWMIVEDGGYAFPVLHDDPTLRPHLASCMGAATTTSCPASRATRARACRPGLSIPSSLVTSTRMPEVHHGPLGAVSVAHPGSSISPLPVCDRFAHIGICGRRYGFRTHHDATRRRNDG